MPETKTYLTIASRGSKLALWQAEHVRSLLLDVGWESQIKIISTVGDRVQNRFLHELGGKGLFVRELEQAMRQGEVDLAVHSCKDLPAQLDSDFRLTILNRHAVEDVMVFNQSIFAKHFDHTPKSLDLMAIQSLPQLAIATASLRRQSLLYGCGHQLQPIRGNIDTRLAKLAAGSFDAIILAYAGLERLGLTDLPAIKLAPTWFVPSPAQGALAIEMLADHPLLKTISQLGDQQSQKAVTTERQILADLGGDCTMPIGCLTYLGTSGVEVHCKVMDYQGHHVEAQRRVAPSWDQLEPKSASSIILSQLYDQGVNQILESIKSSQPQLGKL